MPFCSNVSSAQRDGYPTPQIMVIWKIVWACAQHEGGIKSSPSSLGRIGTPKSKISSLINRHGAYILVIETIRSENICLLYDRLGQTSEVIAKMSAATIDPLLFQQLQAKIDEDAVLRETLKEIMREWERQRL